MGKLRVMPRVSSQLRVYLALKFVLLKIMLPTTSLTKFHGILDTYSNG